MVNVHAHALLPDGVLVLDQQSNSFRWVKLAPPSDKDVLRLTQRLARRVTSLMERRFATLKPAEADVLEATIGEGMQEVPSLTEPAAEDDPPDAEHHKTRTSRRSASVDGFSIHADTVVTAHNRLGLEKLCRYGLRPAFSHQRLSLSDDGQVLLALRRPWPKPGGLSLLSFEPCAFLRRIAALIPPPWAHLVRHYGLFAPHAKGRDLLPAAPVSPAGMRLQTELRAEGRAPPQQPPAPACPPALTSTPQLSAAASLPTAGSHPATAPPAHPRPAAGDAARFRRPALAWAELLRRVFAIDVLVCPRCFGAMTVVAYLTEAAVVEKILTHLGLPASPPPLAPARRLGQMALFDERAADHPQAPCRPRRGGRDPPWSPSDRSADDQVEPATDASDWGA